MKEVKLFGVDVLIDESVENYEDLSKAEARDLVSDNKLMFIETEDYHLNRVCSFWNVVYWQIIKAVETGYIAVGDSGTKKDKKRYKLIPNQKVQPVRNIKSLDYTFKGSNLNSYFKIRFLSGKTLKELQPQKHRMITQTPKLSDKQVKDLIIFK